MKTYLVTGGFTIYEYRSITYDAKSKAEAVMLAQDELNENSRAYVDWEKEDFKVMNDFEIIEVREL